MQPSARLMRGLTRGRTGYLPGPWDEKTGGFIAGALELRAAWGEGGFSDWPYPVFDLYPRLDYVCLLTRSGCPFSCTYCASRSLRKGLRSGLPRAWSGKLLIGAENSGSKILLFTMTLLLLDAATHL